MKKEELKIATAWIIRRRRLCLRKKKGGMFCVKALKTSRATLPTSHQLKKRVLQKKNQDFKIARTQN